MTASPDAGVFAVITNREVYDAVQELGRKLDPVPTTIRDHETRLRSLERRVWIAAGAAGALGGALGRFGGLLGG